MYNYILCHFLIPLLYNVMPKVTSAEGLCKEVWNKGQTRVTQCTLSLTQSLHYAIPSQSVCRSCLTYLWRFYLCSLELSLTMLGSNHHDERNNLYAQQICLLQHRCSVLQILGLSVCLSCHPWRVQSLVNNISYS